MLNSGYGATENDNRQREDGMQQEKLIFSCAPVIIGLLFSALGIFMLVSIKHVTLNGFKYAQQISYAQDLNPNVPIIDNIMTSKPSTSPTSPPSSLPVIVIERLEELEFSLYRDGYSALDLHHDFLIYSIMDGYDAIIEPYASMRLLITNSDMATYYKYSVCETGSDLDSICQYGTLSFSDPSSSIATVSDCAAYDELDIEVTSYDATTNELLQTGTGVALCMYVRREIRDLTSSDLAKTMDAMHKMWVVTDEEGRELYGTNFHDAKYLLEFHHFNAAWQNADHIHEGNGFLPQHIKMTNIVELAMQAVDPSVTLPYWDFTIDSANDSPVAESPIMSPDYFGSMTSPVNPRYGFTYSDDSVVQGGIPDGRWAYIKADVNDKYDDLKAGYGYMRAPWNMNPSPYVSRYTANMMIGTQLPTCSSHYAILQEFDFMDFLINFEDDPHATTHSLIGGNFTQTIFGK